MVKMGHFLNEFAANLQVFLPLVVGLALGLLIFGYFYNRIVAGDKTGQRSLYVIGGVLVTLLAGALFSWKAAALYLVLFSLSGIFMAIGDYQRGKAAISVPKTRIKRSSYKINGFLDDSAMSAEAANRYLSQALKKRDASEVISLIALANGEISNIRLSLQNIQHIQKDG